MKRLYGLLAGFVFASCATVVDVEKSVAPGTGPDGAIKNGAEPGGPVVITIPADPPPPEIIIIEKPLYVPQGTPLPPGPSGRQAVQQSNAEGIMRPQDYSKAAMIYDFDPDWVYEVYTQPLRVCDIRLEPGEKVVETPFVSDSERWILGAGISVESGVEIQHIYAKPSQANLEASLIINTDRRVYHLVLKSFRDVYMPMVRWRYFYSGMPGSYIGATAETAAAPGAAENRRDAAGIDPRFLSFNYKITYGLFGKPRWLPSLVCDDGKKTYITFPEDMLQQSLPAVFEDRNNAVNYRVLENIIIIDKLVEKITVKIKNRQIIIEKKTGG
jgi:type IV secretion system protein VirB9